MKIDYNNKWQAVVIGLIIAVLGLILYFAFFNVASATFSKTICHHTPSNQVTHTFNNLRSYLGHLGTPHSGQTYDTEGACVEPTVTPEPTKEPEVTPTPTIDPCIHTDKGEFAIVSDEVVPCDEGTPTPTPEYVYPLGPSDHGDGLDSSGLPTHGDGLSDGKSPMPTLIPCSVPNTCGWK